MKQKFKKITNPQPKDTSRKFSFKRVASNQSVLLVFILALNTYTLFPSLYGGFTNWDDNWFITENQYIQDITWENFKGMYEKRDPGASLTNFIAFSIEYQLVGYKPFLYHLTNLILHLICTFLVFKLFYLLCKNLHAAFVGTILFSIHPMHLEAVAWITGRAWLFCTLFCLLSFISYQKYIQDSSKKYLYYSVLWFIPALVSQGAAMSLAPALFLFDFLQKRKFTIRLITEKIPFIILAALLLIFTLNIRKQADVTFQILTFLDRLLIAGYSFVFHLYKFFLPSDLAPFYPNILKVNNQMPGFLYYYLAVAFLIVALIVLSIKKTRILAFGIGFYLIIIFPMLRLVPVNSQYLMADRYTYMAHLGIIFPIITGFIILIDNKGFLRKFKMVAWSLFFLVTIIFCWITRNHCIVWNSSATLWTRVLEYYPTVHTAYYNRANYYSQNRKYDLAIADFTNAIKIDKKHFGSWNNRGYAYNIIGKNNEAVNDYNEAAKIEPQNPEVYYNRGIAYGQGGKHSESLTDLNKAIELKPGYIECYNNRGIIYSLMNNHQNALQDFNKAISLQSDNNHAYYNRSMVYYSLNQFDLALKDARLAQRYGMEMEQKYIDELIEKTGK